MAVSWRLVGRVLVVTESGVTSNDEIERAFVMEALSDQRTARGARVLWDSRASVTALSAEDMEWRTQYLRSLAEQGRLNRFALLAREDQGATAALVRSEMPKAVRPLEFAVFTDEAPGHVVAGRVTRRGATCCGATPCGPKRTLVERRRS